MNRQFRVTALALIVTGWALSASSEAGFRLRLINRRKAAECCCGAEATATSASRTQALFNGKNLDGWYTYTTETKYENPGIFTVTPDGMLNIAGGKEGLAYLGGIITKEEFENYHLVVEYKFTGPTYGARKDKARDSGILLHAQGPDGPGPWLASIECQVIEGGDGDIILINGKDKDGKPITQSLTVESEERGGQPYYKPGAPKITMTSGRFNWHDRSPDWKDVVNFRGAKDVQSPHGEWTRIESICDGATITNIVNGKVVMRGTNSKHTKGKIQIQTEGADLVIRKIELTPLR